MMQLVFSLCFLFILSVSVSNNSAIAEDAPEILSKLKGLSFSERQERLIAGAKKEGKVVTYSSGGVRDNQKVVQGFKKLYPYLEVEYSGGGGSKVVQRAHTEFLAKHYVMDLVLVNSFRMPQLLQSGVLGKYESPYLKDLSKELLDPNGILTPTSTTAVVMAYNKSQVKPEQVPKNYTDLLRPEWKGNKMALDLEAHSWFMGILGIMGEEKGLAYSRKLAAQGLIRRRGHTLMSQLMAAGEYPIQVEAYFHRVHELRGKGAPIDYVVTDPLILRPPTTVGLAKKAPHPHAAALYIDYLLSPDTGQKIFVKQNRWPSNLKTPGEPELKDVKIWVPGLDEWLPKQAEVLKKFDDIFGARAR